MGARLERKIWRMKSVDSHKQMEGTLNGKPRYKRACRNNARWKRLTKMKG